VGLIICDWRMPPYTGLDFLKMLKANPRTNTIPFLMVTSESDKKDIFEVINAGAEGYLLKPFTAEVLVKKINAITK
jgi:two-component system chemotaxis response regulator CheY